MKRKSLGAKSAPIIVLLLVFLACNGKPPGSPGNGKPPCDSVIVVHDTTFTFTWDKAKALTVSWDDIDNPAKPPVTGYRVYADGRLIAETDTTLAHFMALPFHGVIKFTVTAVNPIAESEHSLPAFWSFAGQDTIIPPPPATEADTLFEGDSRVLVSGFVAENKIGDARFIRGKCWMLPGNSTGFLTMENVSAQRVVVRIVDDFDGIEELAVAIGENVQPFMLDTNNDQPRELVADFGEVKSGRLQLSVETPKGTTSRINLFVIQ